MLQISTHHAFFELKVQHEVFTIKKLTLQWIVKFEIKETY